ncbi:MAG: hypothetical protein L3K04_04800 [Thermoplasmata archaeon]|nr:hypothetical protein [Thermoplasmata archaeon]MCI4341283.1 hypothetical protein [Thermoplasmata archaeon]
MSEDTAPRLSRQRWILLETLCAGLLIILVAIAGVESLQPVRQPPGLQLSQVLVLERTGTAIQGQTNYSAGVQVVEVSTVIHYSDLTFQVLDSNGTDLAAAKPWLIEWIGPVVGDNDTYSIATGQWANGGTGIVLSGASFLILVDNTDPLGHNYVLLTLARGPVTGSIANVI